MTVWIALLGVGLGSYAFRAVPLFVLARTPLSPRTEELVGRAGLAAITALIVLSTRSAATGGAAPATLAAVGGATVLAARGARLPAVVALGGALYAAVRLGPTLVG
jgi:branched-subunit amino acid transport protein